MDDFAGIVVMCLLTGFAAGAGITGAFMWVHGPKRFSRPRSSQPPEAAKDKK